MAKFHNYYVLCPLIDQKSFLGVSQDKEKGCVIVTLGRNVVNKYRLSDQKQVGGWTSKDHMTSAVIYDESQGYVGVFNNNTIKIWTEEVENLEKVKKYKFPTNIWKLLPRTGQSSLIIFSNGQCASLLYALDNRKSYGGKSLIKDNETIIDTMSYTVNEQEYICYVTKNCKDKYEIVSCPIRVELGDLEWSKMSKIKVSRSDNVYVVGELCKSSKNSLGVFILWSDSKITMYDLNNTTWKAVGTVPWISTMKRVSMALMGKGHLILFGSNMDQDGAIIVAYNFVLGVGSCKYEGKKILKMYSEEARLYCISNRIILETSNHIGMLPYNLKTKLDLSNLLGSHEIIQNECTEIVDWDTPTEPHFEVAKEFKAHLKIGITERNVCIQVIPPFLEKNDVAKVLKLVKEFKDIPESVLTLLLNYSVKAIKTNKVVITNISSFKNFCTAHESDMTFQLLNSLFEIPFSDALLIPYLRDGLTLDDSLFLLSYISYLLLHSESDVSPDYDSKLLDWCMLLMDSFYQQYLMTKDSKVTHVLKHTLHVVLNLIKQLNIVDNTIVALHEFLSEKDTNEELLSYSIEMMQI